VAHRVILQQCGTAVAFGCEADMHRQPKPAESVENDLGCVKTHTSAKCGKYSSLTGHRTGSAQYDLTLIMRNRFEIFYARGGRWSFHTAKTHKRHRPDRNPAVQKAAVIPLRAVAEAN